MFGHNQPSIDNIVEENLLRGLYLSQLNCLTRCIDDPRMRSRHRQVLAQIIQRTNVKTGFAYPGRTRLAADITYYVKGEPCHYSEATIATTISELVECGYIIADKRAAEGKGRALAHYATTSPSIEELQAEIARWCEKVKEQPKRDFPGKVSVADVDTRVNVDTVIDVDTRINVRSAKVAISRSDVDAGVNVDTRVNVDTGVPTVTGREDITPSLGVGETDAPATKKKRKSQISPDWNPEARSVAWVKDHYIANDQHIAQQARKFRDYHTSKGSLMADWPAAWRTWWGNGYHKIALRPKASGALAEINDREVADAFERARLADEAERCRR